MIVPSFSSYAKAPDLAGSFVAGQRLVQSQQQIDDDARSKREALNNQFAIAEMETSARKQAVAQDAIIKSQQLEVEKAYQQQALALKGREADAEQQKVQMAADEAMQQFNARKAIEAGVQEDIRGGMNAADALNARIAIGGATANFPAGVMEEAMRGGSDNQNGMGPPTLSPVQGEAGDEGYRYWQGGPNSRQLVPPRDDRETEATPVPGMFGQVRVGNHYGPAPEMEEYTTLKRDAERIQNRMDSDSWQGHRISIDKSSDPEARLTKTDKQRIKEWNDQKAILDEKVAQAEALRRKLTPSASGGGSTNKIGRFTVEAR